jgi:hypothetical protein
MIVESGSVTMDLDLNGLNGSGSLVARPITLHFAAAANSFFPILVFNDLLRAAEPGSMALIPQDSVAGVGYLPATLGASIKQLVVEKLASGHGFDVAGFLYQKSLPTRLAAHQTPAQSLEKSPSARQCNRSRSTSLLTASRNRL